MPAHLLPAAWQHFRNWVFPDKFKASVVGMQSGFHIGVVQNAHQAERATELFATPTNGGRRCCGFFNSIHLLCGRWGYGPLQRTASKCPWNCAGARHQGRGEVSGVQLRDIGKWQQATVQISGVLLPGMLSGVLAVWCCCLLIVLKKIAPAGSAPSNRFGSFCRFCQGLWI